MPSNSFQVTLLSIRLINLTQLMMSNVMMMRERAKWPVSASCCRMGRIRVRKA